ncbi:hypothetical protein ALC60_09004 [Trachymyrmex zeteki]|uniref:Uncharacterized protein n=1 Tax=Mycetomoellerius zeteki TaxID=64791 RepID=A0A151WVM5_9HYME|nr:hypothetical protein ALC60_09004 [Trachymyrmex zeteki]
MRSVYAHYHAAAVCREWALLPLSSLSEYYHPTTTVTPSTSTTLICLDLTPIEKGSRNARKRELISLSKHNRPFFLPPASHYRLGIFVVVQRGAARRIVRHRAPMRQRARPAFVEIPLYSVHTCGLEFEMDGVCVRDLVMRDRLKDMESSLLKKNIRRIEVEII